VQQRRVSVVMVVTEGTTRLLLRHWTDASPRRCQAELRLVRRCGGQRRVGHDSSLKTGNTGFQLAAEQFSAVMRNWVLKQLEANLVIAAARNLNWRHTPPAQAVLAFLANTLYSFT
jgi:hypothetical protein